MSPARPRTTTHVPRVLLTKPWVPGRQDTLVILPFGSLYLGSYLRRDQPDAEVRVLDPDLEGFPNEDAYVRAVAAARPDIVGITVFSHTVALAARQAARLRRALPHVVLVAGGSHVNAVRAQAAAQLPDHDYYIHGEGEIAFARLVRGWRSRGSAGRDVPGLIRRERGRVVTGDNAFTPDPGAFDPIDYSLIDVKRYFGGSPMGLFHRGKNVSQIITTRGCPFPCTFCAAPLNMGAKVRPRPTENILRDISVLRGQGADEIHLMDDNFTFNREHVLALCRGITERGWKLHFALPNGVRLDRLSDDMLAAMRQAGFYHLGFGVEVGSDASLKKIRKNLMYGQIREKLSLVKRHGLGTTGFFIIGFPFETEQDIRETARAPERLKLDLASFGNFTPLPGTRIYRELVDAGEIPPDYLPSFASGQVTYAPPGISPRRLEQLHRGIILRYYLNLKRLAFMLGRLHFRDFKYVLRRLRQILFRPPVAT